MTAAATAHKPPEATTDPGRDPWDQTPLIERILGSRVLAVPWRDRPRLLLGAGLAVAVLVVVGWWLGRPSSTGPIDGAIPFATAPAADAGPPASASAGGGGPGSGADRAGDPGAATAVSAPVGPGSVPGAGAPPAALVVHVAGAVSRPGIVHLASGARVVDAIGAAGGPAHDADLDQLNLAAPLGDGVQVRVPHEGETLPALIMAPPPASGGGAPAATTPTVVDLNRATAVQLDQLPGIGPSLAAAIVTWRTDHGPFKRVDDLLDVPGIGPAKLASLADRVTV